MRVSAYCGIAVFALGWASSAEGPTFDVASVKLTGPEIQQPFTITGGPGTSDPVRFRAPRIQMVTLLARAFDVATDQLNGPAWLRDFASANNYTVIATMPADTTKEQFQKMLQNLLIERFHLVYHREKRSFPGYELVVDKGGPKFKEVTPTQDPNPDAARGQIAILGGTPGVDGFPNIPGSRTISQISRTGEEKTKYQERTMADFVSNLGFLIGSSQGKSVTSGYLQPRVVDKTGLTGKYTFLLEYFNAGSAQLAASLQATPPRTDSGVAGAATSDPEGGGPNIFVAIQKQLGLRLDKTTDIPLDVIVVDSVDKVPTED
ncbi:MAG TPA: TIGR03435 family protein [Bryobacteraceae bacterium]|jgi:uncharacterized protein (TIGR03435 family)